MLCPYCNEEIADRAIKCKHCSEILDKGRHAALASKEGVFQNPVVTTASDAAGQVQSPTELNKSGASSLFWLVAAVLGLWAAIYFGSKSTMPAPSPVSSNSPNKFVGLTNAVTQSDGKKLYSFWQIKNSPDPGSYEDELVGGEVLYTCQIGGKYSAYFGYIVVRETFMFSPTPNAKPFTVFVVGIEYGNKVSYSIDRLQSAGEGQISMLKAKGCQVPTDVDTSVKRVVEKYAPVL